MPVNYEEPLIFDVRLTVGSTARGGAGETSDGKAQAGAQVTHEFFVPDGYSVEFPFDETLGLAPPQLGVVAPVTVSPTSPAGILSPILPLLIEEQ